MRIRSIYLENFRSYKRLKLNINSKNFIILTGKNGTGKTNLLEAISFLSPGKGFRNSKFSDILNKGIIGNNNSSIHAKFEDKKKKYDIGVGFFKKNETKTISTLNKIIKIDSKNIKKQSELLKILSVIWLVPEMDIFFRTGSLMRRNFLDRFIYNLNPEYLLIVRNYQKNLKERTRILMGTSNKKEIYVLGENNKKDVWLKKIEEKLVDDGLEIISKREEFIDRFNSLPTHSKDFPKIILKIYGELEKIISSKKITNSKEIYLKKLFISRKIDSLRGGISYGPNKTDLKVIFSKKKILAEKCSTGEQKIILITMLIQFCKLMKIEKEISPILLLDELIAHLDEKIRFSLFDELKSLNIQVWMSGTDIISFEKIKGISENLEIEEIVKQ